MSDDLATFRRKNDAQFAKVRQQLTEIGRVFIINLAVELVEKTPGFGIQWPPETEYIPTGRLRGGWRFTTSPNPVASRWEGGPYTDYGEDTIADIMDSVRAFAELPLVCYLENDVAYGYIVHNGLGRHAGRPETAGFKWRDRVARDAEFHGQAAIREVMRRG